MFAPKIKRAKNSVLLENKGLLSKIKFLPISGERGSKIQNIIKLKKYNVGNVWVFVLYAYEMYCCMMHGFKLVNLKLQNVKCVSILSKIYPKSQTACGDACIDFFGGRGGVFWDRFWKTQWIDAWQSWETDKLVLGMPSLVRFT